MSPHFWESKAAQLHPYRWWLGGASLVAFLAVGASGVLGNRILAIATVAIAMPVLVSAWGLLCAALWFEPTRGTLRSSGWLGRHMPPINTVARWCAAIFLPLFLAAGVVGPIWWVFNVVRAA